MNKPMERLNGQVILIENELFANLSLPDKSKMLIALGKGKLTHEQIKSIFDYEIEEITKSVLLREGVEKLKVKMYMPHIFYYILDAISRKQEVRLQNLENYLSLEVDIELAKGGIVKQFTALFVNYTTLIPRTKLR
jgi:hypothetical protein